MNWSELQTLLPLGRRVLLHNSVLYEMHNEHIKVVMWFFEVILVLKQFWVEDLRLGMKRMLGLRGFDCGLAQEEVLERVRERILSSGRLAAAIASRIEIRLSFRSVTCDDDGDEYPTASTAEAETWN